MEDVLALLMSGDDLDFVRLTSDAATSAPHQPTFAFTSAEIGLLAIVFAQSTTTTPSIGSSAGGWTTTDPGDYDLDGATSWKRRIFSKVIAAGDVASGLTLASVADSPFAGAGILYLVGGPTSLSVKTNANSTSGTGLTVTGFTPASNTAGAVAFVVDRDATLFSPPALPPSSTRLTATVIADLTYGVYDWSAADYDEENLTFTGFSATARQNAVLLELLGP